MYVPAHELLPTGVRMNALRRITALAATGLIAAASLTGGTAALASSRAVPRPHLARITTYTFVARDEGEGATLAAAKNAATTDLISDYYGCERPYTDRKSTRLNSSHLV